MVIGDHYVCFFSLKRKGWGIFLAFITLILHTLYHNFSCHFDVWCARWWVIACHFYMDLTISSPLTQSLHIKIVKFIAKMLFFSFIKNIGFGLHHAIPTWLWNVHIKKKKKNLSFLLLLFLAFYFFTILTFFGLGLIRSQDNVS